MFSNDCWTPKFCDGCKYFEAKNYDDEVIYLCWLRKDGKSDDEDWHVIALYQYDWVKEQWEWMIEEGIHRNCVRR